MKTLIRSAFVAAAIVAAGLGVSATAASAKDVTVTLSVNGHAQTIDYRGHDRGFERDRGRHEGWRHHRRRASCSPAAALQKARWMGIRNARIVAADRGTLKLRGRKHGQRVRIVFANSAKCPVIAAR